MKSLIKFIIALLVLSTGIGCEKPQFETQRAVKKAVDTLFRNEIKVLNTTKDSVCQVYQDSLYPILFDSILLQRRKEKAGLLKQLTQ